jgi:hypothetical protein
MFQKLKDRWFQIMSDLPATEWQKRLNAGEVGLEHYKGFLLETYHQAGTNPQIQSYATMFLKGNPRDIVKMFYKHAVSEIGHDILAMNDLIHLGVDKNLILNSKPLPSTRALSANVLFDIQFRNPVRYLGYLFHLEFLPTQNGPQHIEMLTKLGVPKEAVTFLQEHATVDIGHNKLMEAYVNELVKTDAVFEEVADTMFVTASLHQRMLDDSFSNGEKIFK